MKKILSVLLIVTSAFMTISSISCAATNYSVIETETVAPINLDALKLEKIEAQLETLEEKLANLSENEKAKLNIVLGLKEEVDNPSFIKRLASTMYNILATTGNLAYKGINIIGTLTDISFKIFMVWYALSMAGSLLDGDFAVRILLPRWLRTAVVG